MISISYKTRPALANINHMIYPWAISHVYGVAVLLFVLSHTIPSFIRLTVALTKRCPAISWFFPEYPVLSVTHSVYLVKHYSNRSDEQEQQ